MLELCARSLADTHAIAGSVADVSRAGDLIVLSGEMGAGKTAFAQGFGRALGITEPITSPTFTLVHSYDIDPSPGRVATSLHHADLYRLDRTAEIADLALDELAEFEGIVLVEWGDIAGALFGDHLVVHLRSDIDEFELDAGGAVSRDAVADGDVDPGQLDRQCRTIEISASGPSWAARWARLAASCEAYRC